MSEIIEWVALMIQMFGLGWEVCAIIGGLSNPIWAVGFAIWLIGIALWGGSKL